MGKLSKLLENIPEAKRETVVIEGETFTFTGERPGEIVGQAFLRENDYLEKRARHLSQVAKGTVPVEAVRIIQMIVAACEGDEPLSEAELAKLFLRKPSAFVQLANAAKSVVNLVVDPGAEAVAPSVQVGLGNSLVEVWQEQGTSP